MKYYVKYVNGTQHKNKPQKQAAELLWNQDGALLMSEEAKTAFINDLKANIKKINEANPRCKETEIHSSDMYNLTNVAVSECAYLIIYPVKLEID